MGLSAEECRAKAEECRALARQISLLTDREKILEMAASWDRLAEAAAKQFKA